MPIPTPFHPRTAELCTSLLWKEWAGHYAVRSYDTHHDREYFALRHAAGLIDVSPLFKYDVTGSDAAAFLSWLTVRDIHALKPGRMTYLCWCDDDGKVVDDGTVAHLGKDHYRMTSAEPALAWLQRNALGFDVRIDDASERLGTLALQGPASRTILERVCGVEIARLKFFAIAPCRVGSVDVLVSRTGYTGDLGYEIWTPREHAVAVWDAIMSAGRAHLLQPAGLDAMDVTRIEAGFVLNGVDYFSAPHCPIESRKSSPFEIGLGWTVKLDREPFIGQAALQAEQARGSKWAKVGLMIDWDEYEALFAAVGLPPNVPSAAWRTAIPVFDSRGRQIGQATSGAWSPMLKQNLALASIESTYARPGSRLRIEVTVEYHRRQVTAVVTETPFFDPERKRA